MTEKITLRLIADPTTVLPEAEVVRELEGGWALRFAHDTWVNSFHRSHWEPVTPPYTLPTKPGAVVEFDGGYAVLTGDRNGSPWRVRFLNGHDEWTNPSRVLSFNLLVTVSEGVDL